ncbi:MAG: hypothetical protein QNL04_12600 [SAR324 cluster bacterium]|nr:hypothetical protein [SAR324 cluster bacterium]
MFPFTLYSKVYAVNYEVDGSIFGHAEAFDYYPLLAFAGLLVFLWSIFAIRKLFTRYVLQRDLREYHQKKAIAKMDSMMVSDSTAKALELIAAENNQAPDELLNDNSLFEKSVSVFKNKYPKHEVLQGLHQIRRELDYTFTNPKMTFFNTNMIEKGQKIRAYLSVKGETRSFLTHVIRSSEKQLWIKPPKLKGKFLNLSKFQNITFKIYRLGDTEYSFTLPLQLQKEKPVPAVILSHTSELIDLKERPMSKVKVAYQSKIVYLIPEDTDDPFLTKYTTKACQSTISQISTNKLKVVSEKLPDEVIPGSYALFKLKEAQIDERVKGKVVNVEQDNKFYYVTLSILELSEAGRLKLENFMHSHKVEAPVSLETKS